MSLDPRRNAEEEVYPWEEPVELLARAMVLADETLFLAGPPNIDAADNPAAAWEGREGGLLWAVSRETGEKLAEYALDAPPVFDGMIAIPGRLLFSTVNGRVVSFAPR